MTHPRLHSWHMMKVKIKHKSVALDLIHFSQEQILRQGFGRQSLNQEMIPGSTSRWAENEDRKGKAANKGHVVKQVTTMDKLSAVLPKNSGRLCRQISVLFHLRGKGAGVFIHQFTLVVGWKLSLLSLSLFPQPEKKKILEPRTACVCNKELDWEI